MSAAAAKASQKTPDPPDERVNREVVRGVEMMSPRPAQPHALVSSNLLGVLNYHLHHERDHDDNGTGGGPPEGWWIVHEPELHLEGDDPIIPDIAGWRRIRMPFISTETAFRLSPDWVCEVLSPSTSRFDRIHKLPVYFDNGVGHLWLVDPLERMIEVFEKSGGNIVLVGFYGGRSKAAIAPFTELELDLNRIWPPLR